MPVGLDVGSKTIKVIELTGGKSNYELRGSGVVAYSGVSIESVKEEKELAPIADLIRKLFNEAKISSRDVNISIPERFVFVKTVSFPPLTDQEIEAALKWQLDEYVPIPLDQAVVQNKILERVDGASGGVKVLVVAARLSYVERYVALAEMAGLKVLSVENEMISLSRVFGLSSDPVAIVNFGALAVDIGIAKNGNLYVSRSISGGGESLTRSIVQELRIEPAQAEEYKKAYGILTDKLEGKLFHAMEMPLRYVLDELKKTIQYSASEEGLQTKQIVICGGGAGMPGFLPYLTKEFNQEVILGDSFYNVRVADEIKSQISDYSHLYGVAVGLAER